MHNSFVNNVMSKEKTSFQAISVARLVSTLQLCISTASREPYAAGGIDRKAHGEDLTATRYTPAFE